MIVNTKFHFRFYLFSFDVHFLLVSFFCFVNIFDSSLGCKKRIHKMIFLQYLVFICNELSNATLALRVLTSFLYFLNH